MCDKHMDCAKSDAWNITDILELRLTMQIQKNMMMKDAVYYILHIAQVNW